MSSGLTQPNSVVMWALTRQLASEPQCCLCLTGYEVHTACLRAMVRVTQGSARQMPLLLQSTHMWADRLLWAEGSVKQCAGCCGEIPGDSTWWQGR